MKNPKDIKIEFAPEDKIDDFSYDLINATFGIKSALITNESTLEDFAISSKRGQQLPAMGEASVNSVKRESEDHGLRPWESISFLTKNKRVSKKERLKMRRSAIAKIENKFKVLLENYPHNEPLYVWKVAKLVKSKLKES